MGGAAHGVVTRAQLLRAGVTEAAIEQRLRIGALLREHRGVYRVGHRAPSLEARYLAAVWACGEGALSRRTTRDSGPRVTYTATPTGRRAWCE
jgi:Transcriptional regulator, AbiEi antitoxin